MVIMPIVDRLLDWVDETNGDPDEAFWYGALAISSTEMNSKLKANKRAVLHQAIVDQRIKISNVKFNVSKPLESLEEEEEEAESHED
jgi:hypothetical protein